MSSARPTKYGHPAHRPDAGLIQFCDAIEDPPSVADANGEQLDRLRDELFRRRQEFDRARAAFEQQASAQAMRLADMRKQLIACCEQLAEIAERCPNLGDDDMADLARVRGVLETML